LGYPLKVKKESMPEKKMLIVGDELIKKIDENRGELSRSDFINFLIDSQLKESMSSPISTGASLSGTGSVIYSG